MNSTTTPPPTLLASEDMEQEITRLRAEVEQLRAQLAAGGSCQCGDDDVCVIVQERDEARARIRELEAALARIGRRSCNFATWVCPERVPNERDFWCAPCIARAALAELDAPETCDHCGNPCVDYRQRNGERWCIGCVSVDADARIAELVAQVRELRDAAVALADQVEQAAREDVPGILGERALRAEERLAALTQAAAATAETLDALIYWHDCGDIDRSWWEDAREKLAALRAAMGEEKSDG